MATKTVTANTVPQEVFSAGVSIGKITHIEIDNPTANPITVTVYDAFTPTPSAGNPSPSAVTEVRKITTVAANSHIDLRDLDIDIYGICTVGATATDNTVNISVTYTVK